MNIEVLGLTRDLRTETPVVYAQMPVDEYLELVGDDFHQFFIQRRREKHRAYLRMKEDVKAGALLPSITLAVKPTKVAAVLTSVRRNDNTELTSKLARPGSVYILDGLQRTYILRDIRKEEGGFKRGQTIHVEFWLEEDISHLIYRIIVLNAGQKPMSMRHQIELLFLTLKEKLEKDLGIEILLERDNDRRTAARQYGLDRVAGAYQCFLTRSAEVDKENLVAQALIEKDVLDSSEKELRQEYEGFSSYFGQYVRLDDHICRLYPKFNKEKQIPAGKPWFGSDIVMNAFFAAVAIYGKNTDRKNRIRRALAALYTALETAKEGDDPMGLQQVHELIKGINTRKTNLGYATRRLLLDGFREYFKEEGDTCLADCWVAVVE